MEREFKNNPNIIDDINNTKTIKQLENIIDSRIWKEIIMKLMDSTKKEYKELEELNKNKLKEIIIDNEKIFLHGPEGLSQEQIKRTFYPLMDLLTVNQILLLIELKKPIPKVEYNRTQKLRKISYAQETIHKLNKPIQDIHSQNFQNLCGDTKENVLKKTLEYKENTLDEHKNGLDKIYDLKEIKCLKLAGNIPLRRCKTIEDGRKITQDIWLLITDALKQIQNLKLNIEDKQFFTDLLEAQEVMENKVRNNNGNGFGKMIGKLIRRRIYGENINLNINKVYV